MGEKSKFKFLDFKKFVLWIAITILGSYLMDIFFIHKLIYCILLVFWAIFILYFWRYENRHYLTTLFIVSIVFLIEIYIKKNHYNFMGFIGIIQLLIYVFFWFDLRKTHFVKQRKEQKLFKQRQKNFDELKDTLCNDTINQIGIDSKWGSGKTFFVKKIIENVSSKYHIIEIQTSLFSNHQEIQNFLIDELQKMLIKEKLIPVSTMYLKNFFKNIEGKIYIPLGIFFDISFQNIKKQFIENISRLKKKRKIIVIIDDIDRMVSLEENKFSPPQAAGY